jgi:hypothetical protein
VRGPLKGTVEQVVGSPDLQNAQELVVRTHGRRRSIPVEAVDVVVPAAREIVVGDNGVEPTASSACEHSRALAQSGSRAVTAAAAATTARVTPRATRSLAGVLKTVAILVAMSLATLARVAAALAVQGAHAVALAGRRLREDLQAARQAAQSQKPPHH